MKNPQIPNFISFYWEPSCSIWVDSHNKANRRFPQFMRMRIKMLQEFALILSVHNPIDSRSSLKSILIYRSCVGYIFPNNCIYFDALKICLMLQQFAAKRGDQESLLESMNTKYYYYTRTKGLFRICYPKERPPTGKFLTTQEKTVLMGSTVNKQKYFSAVFSLLNSRHFLLKFTFSVSFHQGMHSPYLRLTACKDSS